jgi:hypothetical protein
MRSFIKILIVLTVIWTNSHVQVNGQTKDSIANAAKLLTGKWEFIEFFENGKFAETEISTSFSTKVKGLKTIKIMTDSGLIKKNYHNDSLISIDKVKELEVIEMNFKKNGKGYYQSYSDYKIDCEAQSPPSCQPIPEIKFSNGKYIMHFISMSGENETEFNVKGYTLNFTIDNNRVIRYIPLIVFRH